MGLVKSFASSRRLLIAVVVAVAATTLTITPAAEGHTGSLTFVGFHKDGLEGNDGLFNVRWAEVSPDGKHVYAAGDDSGGALAVFTRSSATGSLSFVEAHYDDVSGVDGLASPRHIAISPDGKHVYVTGTDDDAIAIFSRNATSGSLTFVEAVFDGIDGVDGLDGAEPVIVSADGDFVYSGGEWDKAIAVFSRNATTGSLTFEQVLKDGVDGVEGLARVHDVTISPDGKHLYAAGKGDDTVVVFSRNQATGLLTFVEMHEDAVDGVDGIDGAHQLMVSGDGDHVYVTGFVDDAIALFSRNTSTGALTFEDAYFNGVDGVDGLNGAAGIMVGEDGHQVYATGFLGDPADDPPYNGTLAVFDRNVSTGALTFTEEHRDNIDGINGLAAAASISQSPGGKHLYIASVNDHAVSVFATEQTSTEEFVNEFVLDDLFAPVSIEFLPDDSALIVHRDGTISRADLSETPPVVTEYMDISDRVHFDTERGLLDVILDPDFASNDYFYAYYISLEPGNRRGTISRFEHEPGTDTGDPDSEVKIWEGTLATTKIHQGGGMQFDNDGYLYLSTGYDGSDSQDLTVTDGKVIRINSDGSIPVDNPFFDGPGGNADSVFAYGLRNPFRMDYDPVTDRILVSDVGGNVQNQAWEEINEITSGANFGWALCEGDCTEPGVTDPLYTYAHAGTNAAAISGPIYRGSAFPSEYQGVYFYADYARGWIQYLTFTPGGDVVDSVGFAEGLGGIVDLEEGPDGFLYYLEGNIGELRRFRPTAGLPIITDASAVPTSGQAPLTVDFTGDADSNGGGALVYRWDFGDGSPLEASASPSHTYTAVGEYFAQLTVRNDNGSTTSDPILITVGDVPTVTIDSPVHMSLFRAGDTITFSATAEDGAGSPITDPTAFTWEVLFGHLEHFHPVIEGYNGTSGSFFVEKTGHDYQTETWYQITVEVEDSVGLTASATVDIHPDKVDITFETSPAGMEISVDGIPMTAPFTVDTLIGFEHEVSVAECDASETYGFDGWSDAGDREHTFTVPDVDTTLTATFTKPCGDDPDPPDDEDPTVGLVDPATGIWHLRNSAGAVKSFYYGNPGDSPFMGDWNANGIDTPGLYRVDDGYAYLRNSNTEGPANKAFFVGNPGDVPLPGDYNGDGYDTLSLYRPSTQEFFIFNELGVGDAGLGAADYSFVFGDPGDTPFVGDLDGDGIDEVGLYRETTGLVYYRTTLTTGAAHNQFLFGDPFDRFVAGDWGIVDGVATPAIFRPSDATFYFRHTNTEGAADSQLTFGEGTFLPVAGNFGLG